MTDLGGTSRVAGELWVGAAPPPGMRASGFQHLFLCAKEYQPPPEAFRGLRVHYCPLDDSGFAMTDQERRTASECATQAARYLRRGDRVLVTCAQGRNRSGLVAALALMRAIKISSDGAIFLVRNARGPGALSNDDFVDFLHREWLRMSRHTS